MLTARYTRIVGKWQVRAVSAVVVAVLATLPVIGIVCIVLCAPAVTNGAAAGDDHASVSRCHEPVSGQAAVRGTSGHDCNRHNAAAREARAFLRAVRTDIGVLSLDLQIGPAMPNLVPSTSVRIDSGASPPGASPTRGSLVLRI